MNVTSVSLSLINDLNALGIPNDDIQDFLVTGLVPTGMSIRDAASAAYARDAVLRGVETDNVNSDSIGTKDVTPTDDLSVALSWTTDQANSSFSSGGDDGSSLGSVATGSIGKGLLKRIAPVIGPKVPAFDPKVDQYRAKVASLASQGKLIAAVRRWD